MSFTGQIKDVSQSKYATGAVYVFMAGLILSDLLPTIADSAYFSIERRLRNRWKTGDISAKEYWAKSGSSYYLINPIYWAIIALIVINIKGDATTKMKWASGLIGGGAALAIILKYIKKDEQQLKLEEGEKVELLRQHPEFIEILNKPEFKNIGQMLKSKSSKTELQKGLDEMKNLN